MTIFHFSAECFPFAKTGGLADVVGALPKYLNTENVSASVVIPYYKTKNIEATPFQVEYRGKIAIAGTEFLYTVNKNKDSKLGYDFYTILVENVLDRESIYGYKDDSLRFTAFQVAALDWLKQNAIMPDIIHCHDHHSGLIPFMISHCHIFKALKNIPTILTIHNAQYQGQFSHSQANYLPQFNPDKQGLLDWGGVINPLATAIKCAWRVTTVSPSYLEELYVNCAGLEALMRDERNKCSGLINGIDPLVWNPETDLALPANFSKHTLNQGKKANKAALCKQFNLDESLPLFSFIGRLVGEKAAELLPEIIDRTLYDKKPVTLFILGAGHKDIEDKLNYLKTLYPSKYATFIGYDEKLAHLVYAGSDFLLMPSRVEPCGLNQMYAMTYGTIPIVRRIGGLKDTVIDIGDEGYGICHDQSSVFDVCYSIDRAITLYNTPNTFNQARKTCMDMDFSWNNSAKHYLTLYQTIKN